MKKAAIIIMTILAVVGLAVFFLAKPSRRKEKWLNRDIAYGKANSVLWNRVLQKGRKGIAKEDETIRDTYKYPGTGYYTGMMCRFPDGVTGCTTLAY